MSKEELTSLRAPPGKKAVSIWFMEKSDLGNLAVKELAVTEEQAKTMRKGEVQVKIRA